ncbi:divergent polysaccharide deacetylase family protein [Shewanella avicenniae]|uniref:Divergent polysaccharide deacetylase family protein n=1 Tax=Shewanella avicenniae TaxID=2814294 RepID=A0ABX7QQH8_9GAMM|nr:divergent polysaccharide deacetylase family protein [Shewanella avicenniae]QSX33721.1 divergent polysaccharide deacetylase family protein [Shewanella avicenniae]
MRRLILGLFLALCCNPCNAGQLAIIIDDIGYRHTDEDALSLPSGITLSVLPHTPLGQKLAEQGHHKGHEIMVHLPMQALNGKAMGPGGLNNQMDEQDFKLAVEEALSSVPYAKGSNNHMGSLLTQLDKPMQWLMEVLRSENLYFVDSMTTRYSKASKEANTFNVPLLRRQVFLDNQLDQATLAKQLEQAMTLAKQDGQAVLIAHPYPETIAFLKRQLKERLKRRGVELVKASELLSFQFAKEQSKKDSSNEQL